MKSNKHGFFVSVKETIIILILFCVTIIIVGLLAGLVKAPCSDNKDSEEITPTASPQEEKTTSPPEEAGPWQDPFLPSDIFPKHYNLWFYPDFYYDAGSFMGKADIEIHVDKSTKYIIIHHKLMNITKTRVTEDGNERGIIRTFVYDKNEYWVIELEEDLKSGSEITLHLEFKGSLLNGIVGYYKSTYINSFTGKESWLSTTKFQPTDARKAYPCFDEPKFKTTFTVTQKHWKNFTALSNMPEEYTTDLDETWRETKFKKTTVPLSTYMICFIVTDFKSISNTLQGGQIHRIWTSEDKLDQAKYALTTGKIMSDFFEDEFAINFHLPKLDQVAVPDYPSGATEHWGLITYRETSLLYDENEVSASGKERVAMVIGHELAHNYFGNAITCEWWDDIWLNEGFAGYYEFKALAQAEPSWQAEDLFIPRVQQSVMPSDAAISSRAVVTAVTTPNEINQAFSGIVYDKGASLLKMTEDFMGEDIFREAIRDYIKTHEFGSVKTQDLWDSLQKQLGSNLNVTAIMKTWSEQMGFPVININFENGNIKATPRRFLTNSDADLSMPKNELGYVWYIPLTYVLADGTTGLQWVNKTELIFNDVRESEFDWIKFNNKHSGFYRINYPKNMWEVFSNTLLSNLDTFDVRDRSDLLDDAFALAKANQLDYTIALDLTKYLSQETEYLPWTSAASSLTYISHMLYGHVEYNYWISYMRNLTKNIMEMLGYTDKGLHLEKLLRSKCMALSCSSGSRECLGNVSSIFADWIQNPMLSPISPSLRSNVYKFGMRESGNEDEWDKMWQLYISATSSQEKLLLLHGLAQVKDPWLIRRYLEYCLDVEKVSSQNFFSAINYVADNPHGILILWDWVRMNYQALVDRFGTQDRSFGKMVPNIVSQFKTEFHLKQVKEFYADYPDAGAGKGPRDQSLNSIQTNILWLEQNDDVILNWLKNNPE